MSARFEVVATPLAGLQLVRRLPIRDERGWFERLYCADEFATLMAGRGIAQINRTLSAQRGTVRGLHYQTPPHAEAKLVSCLRGAVFDVAVDVRRGSATFLKWHAVHLSADNHHSLLIPPGFAHGFQTLEDNCELLYLHTAAYAAQAEAALNAGDPRLAIEWPAPISGQSARDAAHPLVGRDFQGVGL
jgi:dTDP-4-dehydrorhamnose 3,5-epimerase